MCSKIEAAVFLGAAHDEASAAGAACSWLRFLCFEKAETLAFPLGWRFSRGLGKRSFLWFCKFKRQGWAWDSGRLQE